MRYNAAYWSSFFSIFGTILSLIALAFSISAIFMAMELKKILNRIKNNLEDDELSNSKNKNIIERLKNLETIVSVIQEKENNKKIKTELSNNRDALKNEEIPRRAKPMPSNSLRLRPMHDETIVSSIVENVDDSLVKNEALELKSENINNENNLENKIIKFVEEFKLFTNNPNKSPVEYKQVANKYGKLYNAIYKNEGLKILGEFDAYNEQSYIAIIVLTGSNYCLIIPHFNWISSFFGPSASLRHIDDAVSAAFDLQLGDGEMQYKRAAIGKITENGDILVSSRGILYGFKAG